MPSLIPDFTATDAIRLDGSRAVYWYFSSGQNLLLKSFILSTVDVGGQTITDIQSPYGSGGVLSTCDKAPFRDAALEAFAQWALATGVTVEFLRLHPLLSGQHFYVQDIWTNRTTIQVNLTQTLMEAYSPRKRSYLRRELLLEPTLRELRGLRGVNLFATLYEENMKVVGASQEYLFPAAYFQQLLQLPFARLWGLFYPEPDGLLAAAVTLENKSSKIVEYHLGASRRLIGRRSMELLLHLIGQRYANSGYTSLFLGGGRSASPDDSLLRFKRSFSPIELPYRIGRNVYQPEIYNDLRTGTKTTTALEVLFYRRKGMPN